MLYEIGCNCLTVDTNTNEKSYFILISLNKQFLNQIKDFMAITFLIVKTLSSDRVSASFK